MWLNNVMAGSFAICLSSMAIANDGATVDPNQARTKWYVGLGQVSIDSVTATSEGVKDSAPYIRLAVESQKNTWLYGGGISGYFYSDEEKFKQAVEDQFGNQSTASSNADSFNLYGETGIGYSLSHSVSTDLLGGYELVVQSSRAISNCTDCASEDIDIDAGLYINPRVRFQTGNRFSLSLSYQQYLSGDVESAAALNLGWSFK